VFFFSFFSAFSPSTLLSIRDFMLRATQTKWISRFVARASIQEALIQYDQQLRDAAMSFQVRPVILTTILSVVTSVKLN